MLILSRSIGESIMIGDDVVVTVTKLSRDGRSVSIGITAPKHIAVHREEVAERIKLEGAKRA